MQMVSVEILIPRELADRLQLSAKAAGMRLDVWLSLQATQIQGWADELAEARAANNQRQSGGNRQDQSSATEIQVGGGGAN